MSLSRKGTYAADPVFYPSGDLILSEALPPIVPMLLIANKPNSNLPLAIVRRESKAFTEQIPQPFLRSKARNKHAIASP